MKKFVLLLNFVLAFVLLTTTTYAQATTAASYSFSRVTGATYTSIIPGSTVIGVLSSPFMTIIDSLATSIPIGFAFNYCGTDYSILSAGSNGWLSLINSATDVGVTPGSGVGLLMPFRCIAHSGADTVCYTTSGTAPLRIFTIEYKRFNPDPGAGLGNFQVKLYETSNMIRFCYGGSTMSWCAATIGISNSITDYQTLPAPVSTSTSSFVYTTTLPASPSSGVELIWQPSPSFASSMFGVYINKLCNGPEFTVITNSSSPLYSVRSYFGDGSTASTPVVVGSGGIAGIAVFDHSYNYSGTYTIKHVLYNGTAVVDSIIYSNAYVLCKTLPIRFYYDLDNDCTYTPGTDRNINFPFLTEIDSNSVPIDTISAINGFDYFAFGNPGDIYAIKPMSTVGGIFVSCPLSGVLVDTLYHSPYNSVNNYLGVSCVTGSAIDLSADPTVPILNIASATGDIYPRNTYCLSQDAVLTLQFSPKYQYYEASPAPFSTTAASVIWHIPSLSIYDSVPSHIHYKLINNPVAGSLMDGDTVHSTFTITPLTGDVDVSNNIIAREDTVRASYDPNQISVIPVDCLPATGPLHFTIQFENTGHDTAHNIYLLDTLSDNLNPSTMRMVAASHRVIVSKLSGGGHTILKFDFPEIKLPDSSHHGLCDGMVMYDISPRSGLPYGTSVLSRTGIYFDYNPVVMTNTVSNTRCFPVGITDVAKAGETDIYPNPATDLLTIKTVQGMSLTITSSIGQVMMQQAISTDLTNVPIKALPSGMYYITVRGMQGSEVRKFVKW